ncbi:hypothetical protein [Pantanalinema sp. GBBB05]|uniref:terminase small subunit-like protein n=1 Tax=Pantanalinema sp. GBBB05 TaxID=2604139 RepID=UPI001DE852C7|nr:hypothetical protein [Pantanalinema sp. GBBB05]
MAKSKYTPDTVKTILDAIARTGSDRAGIAAGGISDDTFYQWMNRYAEFSERVLEARQRYRDLCPETLIAQANKAFADYLFGRATRTEVTEKDEPEGRTVTTKTITTLPPRWAIERVLGKSDHEKHLAALYALIKKIMALDVGELGEIKSMIQADLETLLLEVGVEEVRSILGIAQASKQDEE